MRFFPNPRGARALAIAALWLGSTTPAHADSWPSFRAFSRLITPANVDTSPDYDMTGEGLTPDRVSVAAGPALVNEYEGSDRYGLAPAGGADARFHGHAIMWHGTSLGVDLIPEYRSQKFKLILAPSVDLDLDRTESPRDPVVDRLPHLKAAAEGGAVIGFGETGVLVRSYDRLAVQVALSHDLGTVHHSYVITPSASYALAVSKAALVSALASFDMVGAGYARTYFGVDSAASAATGLPIYRPGAGIKSASFGFGGVVSLRGDLRKGFGIGGLVRYERLVGDCAGSPLVAMRGSPDQFNAAVGVAYTF